MKITNDWVNVSHSIGVPFGAIGTGYGVYGKYGFVRPNFNSTPDTPLIKSWRNETFNNYLEVTDELNRNFLTLNFKIEDKIYSVQEIATENSTEILADKVESYAFLPFSKHIATFEKLNLCAELLLYSPLIPHNLKESTTPALCMDIKLKNTSDKELKGELYFTLKDINDSGVKVSFDEGETKQFSILPNDKYNTNAFLAWYYPEFKTPSPKATDTYIRYYTENFKNADSVLQYAKVKHNEWKEQIEKWQNSVGMPAEFKRMWFNSLSSVMTSTMMSTEPYFFEIESPHFWINTMDVTIYSAWIYMINWPEIEKMDMYQYKQAIDSNEEKKGFVWHSLWSDGTHYVEEPCYITRIYRDYLWYNDKKFLSDMSNTVNDALNRVYGESVDGLIESIDGNQSYDMWKMPGICTYVNMPWLYALYSVLKINKILGTDISVTGVNTEELLEEAKKNFVKYLWNEEYEYFNAFKWTENSKHINIQDAVFADQMFGRWLLLIEKDLDSLLPIDMIKKSLNYIYENNLIDDKENGMRGWSNGMLKEHQPCEYNTSFTSHESTWWLGEQLDLSSLLGELGEEEKALDVFNSVEKSLRNNHLAVGEWNGSTTDDGKCLLTGKAKDTPSFPAYPRYKCCWEMLIRILGLKMDEKCLELTPFKSFDFYLNDFKIAGCELTVNVEKDWNKIFVDGEETAKAVFDRSVLKHKIEFKKV